MCGGHKFLYYIPWILKEEVLDGSSFDILDSLGPQRVVIDRPSSLSLQNYSSSSQVLRPAMCKANRSMVVVTKPRRASISCSSKVVHSQFSNESVQTNQRRRESVPQLASGLQVAKVRRASVIGGVYVTDAAGNTKRLAPSSNIGHSPTHKLLLSNNLPYGGASLKLMPEKSPAPTYGTQEVPEQKVFKVKTTYPVKYSPKRNLPSYFRQQIGVVDSPPVSPHSQGATSSSSEEKTASPLEAKVLRSHHPAPLHKAESFDSSRDEEASKYGSYDQNKKPRKVSKLRKYLFHSTLAEKENRIKKFEKDKVRAYATLHSLEKKLLKNKRKTPADSERGNEDERKIQAQKELIAKLEREINDLKMEGEFRACIE